MKIGVINSEASSDKGKGILVEDISPPKTKTKRQMEEERLSAEAVRRLIEQDTADLARENEERLRQQEVASAGSQGTSSVAPDVSISSEVLAEGAPSTSVEPTPNLMSAIYIPGRRCKRMATRRGYFGSIDLKEPASNFVEE